MPFRRLWNRVPNLSIRKRSRQSVAERVVNRLTAMFRRSHSGISHVRMQRLRDRWNGTAIPAQMLEPRLLLSGFNLASFPAVTQFEVDATTTGGDVILQLKNRVNSAVLATVVNASTDVTVTGTTNADDLHIDLSHISTFNGAGVNTGKLGVGLIFDGGAGVDSVTFTGNTAATTTLTVNAENIGVNSGVRVHSTAALSFLATAGVSGTASTNIPVTGTNVAAISVAGHVSGTTVTLTAQTQGTVNTTEGAVLGLATNEFTDSATIAVADTGKIEGTTVGLLARRSSTYNATGRAATNKITGDTSITIGTSSGATIESDGSLSIRAINNLTATATSNRASINPTSIQGDLAAAVAQNLISGDTSVVINGASVSQTGTGQSTTISSQRTVAASALAEGESLVSGALPTSTTLSLGGIYAANHLSGDVLTDFNGGSLTAVAATITADDDATATVKSELTAGTDLHEAAIAAESITVGASLAFNRIDNTTTSALDGAAGNAVIGAMSALLGTTFGATGAAETKATLDDVGLTISGDLTVSSDSAARVNSTVSNTADSTSHSLYGSSGSSAAGTLATNLIDTESEAHVIYATASPLKPSVSGALSITATDSAAVYANTKLTSSAIVTNDGGVRLLQGGVNTLFDANYVSSAGSVAIKFGEVVRVDSGPQLGRVYEYLGVDRSVGNELDLSMEDFTDLDVWKPVDGSDLIPQGNNISDSSSIAVGGILVRNDVDSSAVAKLENADLNDGSNTTGSVTVTATESAVIHSTADAAVESSGGSAYGTGTSLAAGGVIATNSVRSNADASISGSSITTTTTGGGTGHVTVAASNTSSVDATNKALVDSGDTGVAVSLAFNTIGYPQSNILLKTLEQLIGTNLGTAAPAKTSATITDSAIAAAQDVSVTASSTATMKAILTNEATSAASALVDASSLAVGAAISSNMVQTDVDASITDTAGAKGLLTAGDDVTVSATDDSSLTAETTLKAVSSTTNDGGASLVNTFAAKLMEDYRFSSKSGSRLVKFGDKVRVASDHTIGKGERQAIYQYMGTDTGATIDLTTEDYSQFGFWKKLDTVNVLPTGLNVTDSDSIGVGGLVTRNDLVGDVDATVTNMDITSGGHLTVAADGTQNLNANADATASSSGGSAFGTGDSIAVGASIVTNVVQGGASAVVSDSSLTTTSTAAGDANVSVTAKNTASINAVNKSAILSGDTAVGVTLAFNTLGYQGQDVLTRTIDALVRSSIGTADPSKAEALVNDTTISSKGNVTVKAESSAQLKADLTNETESAASALVNATGMAIGTVLASNMVNAQADADLDFDADSAGNTVQADGTVTVEAKDRAGIDAESQLDAISTTTNDGGVSTAIDWLNQFFDNQYQYTNKSGERDLGGVDFQHESRDGEQMLSRGTRVLVRGTGGASDQLFEYVGVTGTNTKNVNLTTEDYSVRANWQPVVRRSTTKVRISGDHTDTNIRGNIYRFVGTPATNVDLGTEVYTNTSRWERVQTTNADFIPQIGNITDSDSIGVGVLIVRNDVISSVDANIDKARVTTTTGQAGDVVVNALEQADLRAVTENVTSSSGGSAFGEGTSIGVGTTVATNLVLSSAAATITNSTIDADGNVNVYAENRSGIDATTNTSVSSGDTAVGATLAINTLGYQSQNILFGAIDTLLQTNIGTAQPAKVEAYIRDSTVTADGSVSVTADNKAALNATISNVADSAASALFNASGAAASLLLTSNMVATDADASIDFTEPGTPTVGTEGTLTIGGTLLIKAVDDTEILANTKLVASSTTSNNGGASVLKNSLQAVDPTPPTHVSTDGTRTVNFGDTVKLDNGHTAGGDAGSRYKFLGADGTSLKLDEVDFSDIGYWLEDSATRVIPEGLNLTDSDSIAVGGLVVRNDVTADVDALLKNTTANVVGSVTITAVESAVIRATTDAETESSGGSAFGEGTSLAVGGYIATNNVLSTADALVRDSVITTTGTGSDIEVLGENTAVITAKTLSSASTGDTAITGTLAFNSIGYAAQNLLFNTVNALLGSSVLGTGIPADTSATVQDSTLTAADAIRVQADNTATIRATISNKTDSQASALVDASGKAIGLALTTNLVSSGADAKIVSTTGTRNATAGAGGLTVEAIDSASIVANSRLQSLSSTTNDGGLGLILDTLVSADGIDFSDRSGTRTVKQDDLVIIDAVDYTSFDTPEKVTTGERVELQFDISGGAVGDVFEYVGSADLLNVDFEQQTFSDTSKWKKLQATPEEIYKYLGTTGSLNLSTQNYGDQSKWLPMSSLNPTAVIPGLSLNLTSSDSAAFGGLIVRNEVDSDVDATMTQIVAQASGDIYVHADLTGEITAQTRSTVTSSGGSAAGEGDSIAFNAVISTNVVNATADALVTGGSLTTTGTGSVRAEAENDAKLDATVAANVESNGYGIGVVLAFNTVGWEAQNFLFNTVDTIAGSVLGTKTPVTSRAIIDQAAISAAGGVSVKSETEGRINAVISNSNSTISVTPAGGSDTVTVGGMLALNKVATDSDAKITSPASLAVTGGHLEVGVRDDATVQADVQSSSIAIGAGTASSSGVAIGLTQSRNEVDSHAEALLQNVGTSGTPATVAGDVRVTAVRNAGIDAVVTSTSVGVAVAAGKSVAVSGGGTFAFNTITGSNNAMITGSTITTTASGGRVGDVKVTTDDDATIDALVRSISVSVAVGTKTAAGVAIGLSTAKNFIGFNQSPQRATYRSGSRPVSLSSGDRVEIISGANRGKIFTYSGSTLSDVNGINLSTQNYGDTSKWTADVDFVSTDNRLTLTTGQTVKVTEGSLSGQTFEYLGPNRSETDAFALAAENFHDKSIWKLRNVTSTPGQVFATVQ
ncbi:MAG: hypothetical protein NXI04_13535, partial [Planctomycetaceae bacterium]|nr:hypothetical protein [Planctomycetaceae bacterium]